MVVLDEWPARAEISSHLPPSTGSAFGFQIDVQDRVFRTDFDNLVVADEFPGGLCFALLARCLSVLFHFCHAISSSFPALGLSGVRDSQHLDVIFLLPWNDIGFVVPSDDIRAGGISRIVLSSKHDGSPADRFRIDRYLPGNLDFSTAAAAE